jgi:hypothetical protein
MTATYEPIDLWMLRGDAAPWQFQVVQKDGTTPQDITGMSLRFVAKRRLSLADDDPGVIVATVANGRLTVDSAVQGLVTLKLEPGDTSGLGVGMTGFEWNLQVTDALGKPQTPLYGTLVVRGDVAVMVP